MSTQTSPEGAPWWQFGHVWLIVAGPLVVVLASFFTFYLAYAGMDALVTEADFRPVGKGCRASRPISLRRCRPATTRPPGWSLYRLSLEAWRGALVAVRAVDQIAQRIAIENTHVALLDFNDAFVCKLGKCAAHGL